MKLRVLVLATLLFLTATAVSFAQTSASQVVEGFYATLQDTMKQGPQLGFKGRFQKLEPAVQKAFNMPLMTRYATGPVWRNASKQEQDKLTQAFTRFSAATYASRFTKYDGEVFKVLGEKAATGGAVIVETHLIPQGEEPVRLNYLLRKDETGNQRIVDVYLDASISELATRRADFSSIAKQGGVSSLTDSLSKKVQQMEASSKN